MNETDQNKWAVPDAQAWQNHARDLHVVDGPVETDDMVAQQGQAYEPDKVLPNSYGLTGQTAAEDFDYSRLRTNSIQDWSEAAPPQTPPDVQAAQPSQPATAEVLGNVAVPGVVKRRKSGSRMPKRAADKNSEDLDLVKEYLEDISQHPLLTKDDEVRLAQAIEAGVAAAEQLSQPGKKLNSRNVAELRKQVAEGEAAKQTFINTNLRLVVSVAKKYQSSGLPLLDLIQEGNMGLMHAVDKFDWHKGFKFSTYSTWWIRQAVTRGIANTGRTIRLPVHTGDDLLKLNKARAKLAAAGKSYDRAALSEYLHMDMAKVEELLQVEAYQSSPVSLNAPSGADSDTEIGEFVGAEDVEYGMLVDKVVNHDTVRRMLAVITDTRMREIIEMRYGLRDGQPMSLKEMSQYFDLSQERIRQLENKALAMMREADE